MNVCNINVIQTSVTLQCISCASMSFTNPFLWLYGIVKCPSYVHFKISLGVAVITEADTYEGNESKQNVYWQ